ENRRPRHRATETPGSNPAAVATAPADARESGPTAALVPRAREQRQTNGSPTAPSHPSPRPHRIDANPAPSGATLAAVATGERRHPWRSSRIIVILILGEVLCATVSNKLHLDRKSSHPWLLGCRHGGSRLEYSKIHCI